MISTLCSIISICDGMCCFNWSSTILIPFDTGYLYFCDHYSAVMPFTSPYLALCLWVSCRIPPVAGLLSGFLLVPFQLFLHEQRISHLSHVETPVALLSIVELFASSRLSQILCKLAFVVLLSGSLFRPPVAVTVRITIHVFDTRLSLGFVGKKWTLACFGAHTSFNTLFCPTGVCPIHLFSLHLTKTHYLQSRKTRLFTTRLHWRPRNDRSLPLTTLFNTDCKIYGRVLSRRLYMILGDIIHSRQHFYTRDAQ